MTASCRRCAERQDFFTSEKIASLAAEIKIAPSLAAKEEVFEKRVQTCRKCDALQNAVLCAHCGCFIIFRARPAKSYCPHPEGDKWKEI